jgi:uncharacterized protein (DUF849 family)
VADGRPVLVKACLNGARDPGEHPSLPRTAEQAAREAGEAVEAGAGALHVHPRGPSGGESLDNEVVGAWLEAIRAAVPGVPVGVTTGAWIVPHPDRLDLVGAWEVLPDFASVNVSEDGAVELAELLLGRGVGVEPGVVDLDDTRRLLESGLSDRCVRVLIEVEGHDADASVEQAAAIDAELERAGLGVAALHHGYGLDTWAVIDAALSMGRDIRVGLEDTLELPDGSRARGNADLVAAAVRMAREHGLEPVPP